MVSLLQGRVTRDGRKRAPLMLYGVHYRKTFPFVRCGLTFALLAGAALMSYRRSHYVAPHERFLGKIVVAPYGVLGTQMSLQGTLLREAPLPDHTTAITDPVDLSTLHRDDASASATTTTTKTTATATATTALAKPSGTSAAVYTWLGLRGALPREVTLAVSKVCDARHHSYDEDGKHVIHVAVPDFREGVWSEREAALELSRAYRNALHEFVVSECATLRLAPLSSGERAGALHTVMPVLTHEALQLAFEQLHIFDKEYVLRDSTRIELCVFTNRDWDMYKNAFATLSRTRMAGGAAGSGGRYSTTAHV